MPQSLFQSSKVPKILLEKTEARDRAIFRIGEHYLYLVVLADGGVKP